MTTTTTPARCDKCGYALISEHQAAPWCGFCGWKLDTYEPRRRKRDLAWRWLDRIAFAVAFAQNRRQYDVLAAVLGRRS